jgi:hypothetical protein
MPNRIWQRIGRSASRVAAFALSAVVLGGGMTTLASCVASPSGPDAVDESTRLDETGEAFNYPPRPGPQPTPRPLPNPFPRPTPYPRPRYPQPLPVPGSGPSPTYWRGVSGQIRGYARRFPRRERLFQIGDPALQGAVGQFYDAALAFVSANLEDPSTAGAAAVNLHFAAKQAAQALRAGGSPGGGRGPGPAPLSAEETASSPLLLESPSTPASEEPIGEAQQSLNIFCAIGCVGSWDACYLLLPWWQQWVCDLTFLFCILGC